MSAPNTVESTAVPNASLRQILERSRLLTSKLRQRDFPHIDRDLEQIEEQSKKLSLDIAPADNINDVRAHYFLAQGGVNTQLLVRDLGAIHIGAGSLYPEPIKNTDIEGFLHQKHTRAIIELVQSEKQGILNDTDATFEHDLNTTLRGVWDRMAADKSDTSVPTNFRHTRIEPSLFFRMDANT